MPKETQVYADAFERPDGPMGSLWAALGTAPRPMIVSNRLEAATPSRALNLTEKVDAPRVRVRYTCSFDSAAGAEVYVIADDDLDPGDARWMAGLWHI